MVIRRVQVRDERGRIRPARKITKVWEVRNYEDYIEVASWDPLEDEFTINLGNSVVLRKIGEFSGLPIDSLVEEVEKRRSVLDWLVRTGKTDYRSVATYIYRYYMNPEGVLKEIGYSPS
jgi:flagellar protein FlaI